MRLRELLNEVKLGSQAPKYLELIKKALGSKTYDTKIEEGYLIVQYDDVALIFNQEKYLVGFKDQSGIYNVSKDLKSIKQLKNIKNIRSFMGREVKSVDQLKEPQTPVYSYFPKEKGELKTLIKQLIKERGTEADLNDIDVSNVTSMYDIFFNSKFNGDISKWDVSNVTTMEYMFEGSKFNGDISKWDVSNVERMGGVFRESNFNGDISKWDVSNVKSMNGMFFNSKFNGDISKWDVSSVTDMKHMFKSSPLEGDEPDWYKA